METPIGGGGGRAEAERCLGVAEKLLAARDLVGAKRFADRALAADPFLPGIDRLLAVADVLLASHPHRDHYSILQLPHPSSGSETAQSAVVLSYRRLALLLHPDQNSLPGAEDARRLVSEAFAALSDSTKTQPPPATSAGTFWTSCPSCCHVHQYPRTYQALTLRCPQCHRPFRAIELASPPPVVPGTDMYYCSWGFFPLGFPSNPADPNWRPFYPINPSSDRHDGIVEPPPAPQPPKKAEPAADPSWNPSSRSKKTVARKKVGGNVKKRVLNSEDGSGTGINMNQAARGINMNEAARGININEAAGGPNSGRMAGDNLEVHIDLDATEEILGNLQDLPFLRDEEMPIRMPD